MSLPMGKETVRVFKSIVVRQDDIGKRQSKISSHHTQQTLRLNNPADLADFPSETHPPKSISGPTFLPKSHALNKPRDQQDLEDDRLNAYIWGTEKEKELQALLDQKIEKERLQSHTDVLDNLIENKRLKMLAAESQRPGPTSVHHLSGIIRNADLIQGEIQSGSLNLRYRQLARELGDQGRAKAHSHVLNSLKSAMVSSKSEIEQNTNMLLHKLRLEKLKMLKSEQDHIFRLAVKDEINTHGYELLAHVEQGKQPEGIGRIAHKLSLSQSQSAMLRRSIEYEKRPLERVLLKNSRFVEAASDELSVLNSAIANAGRMMMSGPNLRLQGEGLMDKRLCELGERVIDSTVKVAYNDLTINRYKKALVDDSPIKDDEVNRPSASIQRKSELTTATEAVERIIESAVRDLLSETIKPLEEQDIQIGTLVRDILCRSLIEGRKVKSTYQHMLGVFEELHEKRGGIPLERFDLQRVGSYKRREDAGQDGEGEVARIDVGQECMTAMESEKLRGIECEYWNCYKLAARGHYLGDRASPAGISILAVSPNGRFIATCIKGQGYILIYDSTKTPPKLVRTQREPEKEVISMSFSNDGWSQIVAVFSDGTANLYSTKSVDKTVSSSCPYADRSKEGETPLDLVLVRSFDGDCFQYGEHAETEQVTAVTFHPAFNLFGGQQTVMLGGKGGDILKWNSDGIVCSLKDIPGQFNPVYLRSFLTAEPPFPPNSSLLQISSKRQKEGLTTREFHVAHKSRVIFLDFVMSENQLVSVDSDGHVFVWEYTSIFLEQGAIFTPRFKFRLLLETTQYVPKAAVEAVVRFPPGDRKDDSLDPASPEDMRLIRDYMSEYDISGAIKEAANVIKEGDGSTTYVIPQKTPSGFDDETTLFHELTLASDKSLVRHVQRSYVPVVKECVQLLGVRINRTKELLLLQLLVPHVLENSPVSRLEFVTFRLYDTRVHHVKISIEVDTSTAGKGPFPFEYTDNIQPWNVPYVCVHLQDTFSIYSILTGQQVLSVYMQKQLRRDIMVDFEVGGFVYGNDRLLVWAKNCGSVSKYEVKHRLTVDVLEKVIKHGPEYMKAWSFRHSSSKK